MQSVLRFHISDGHPHQLARIRSLPGHPRSTGHNPDMPTNHKHMKTARREEGVHPRLPWPTTSSCAGLRKSRHQRRPLAVRNAGATYNFIRSISLRLPGLAMVAPTLGPSDQAAARLYAAATECRAVQGKKGSRLCQDRPAATPKGEGGGGEWIVTTHAT